MKSKLNKQKANEVVEKIAQEMKQADRSAGGLAMQAQFEKSGWAVNHEATAPATNTDATYALFAGVRFRNATDKADMIKRVRWYVEEATQAIQSVIEDVKFQQDRLEKRVGEKAAQVERLERAIIQISGNRASEVINACRETFGSSDKAETLGLAGRRN